MMDRQAQKHSTVGQACPTCDRHFDRVEHLKRHLVTHTKERNCVCRVCGRKFSRIDALNRHQNVHRPHVPLRRFRACTQCAASRVKCSGTPPCARCAKKSLACTFPDGSEPHVHRALDGPDEPGDDDAPDTNAPSEEMRPIMVAAQQQQQEQQQPAVPTQEHRTAAYVFMQQQAQQVDLMSNHMDTHMISTLNWIPPTMDFDLAAGFDYNPMASSEQYWDSPTDIGNVPSQAPAPTQTMSLMEDLPLSTPGSFPDSSDAERLGTAYVDSKGFRQPRAGRYASRIFGEEPPRQSPRVHADFQRMTPEPESFTVALAPVSNLPSLETDALRVQQFSLEQYRIMCRAFQDCCLTPNGAFQNESFLPCELPSMAAFSTLMTLYERHFDPKVLPIIHPQLLHEENGSSWVVKLAMSAIGSQYLGELYTELAVALHEFLRRLLQPRGAIFSTATLTTEATGLVQAKLLNYIGLAYCGSRRLARHRISALHDLVREYMSLHRTHPTVLRGDITTTTPQDHPDWLLSESARRLCHAIWLLESMSRCHFDTPSSLLLDFAEIALPCKEDLWQAEPHDPTGQTVPGPQPPQPPPPPPLPTLEKALRVLYVEKRLLHGLGDFAQVLIIHGLFCQTWDIAKSLSKPLLRWIPSAQKGNAESHELTSLSWLPQTPLYNHWRNAACDCLDVLHWIANSDVAKAGTENSTVLHLHFARLVLLAPYQTIREMAELLASEAPVRNNDASSAAASAASAKRFQQQCQEIQRWITDDQFKARLALVHCGVLFWHVRRYSTDAFYEPTEVFLATLVVWAYGSLCPPQQLSVPSRASYDRSRDDSGDWSSDLDDTPSSICLDRPTDDELVQIFIKRGKFMSATIMGVGNITSIKGPSRMLREGCKLLNTLDKWPIRRQYLQILTRLADVCGRDRQWLQTGLGMTQTSQGASSL